MNDEESSSNFSSLNKKKFFLFDFAKEFSVPEMTIIRIFPLCCGRRQFFDEVFCLSVGKAYRSEKGVRTPAHKSYSTDFDGEK